MCSTNEELLAWATKVLFSGPPEGESNTPVVVTLGHAVKVVVDHFVSKGYTFTAYNVTRAIRHFFPIETFGVYVEHQEVRELVHAYYQGDAQNGLSGMPGYSRYQDNQIADQPLAFRPIGDLSRRFPPNQLVILALGQVTATILAAAALPDPDDPTKGVSPTPRKVAGQLLSPVAF